MFTGIIQSIGQIRTAEKRGLDIRFVVATGKLPIELIDVGDSISVNGVCLTAVELTVDSFAADVSNETLSCTTLKSYQEGMSVNLELALTPSTRMGGHIVSGHVDDVGVIQEKHEDGRSIRFRVGMPKSLARYIVVKGSVCVDGISLTVNKAEQNCFHINIVPHTLAETTLGMTVVGQHVNLEVDLLGRYLERLISVPNNGRGQLDLNILKKAGFV